MSEKKIGSSDYLWLGLYTFAGFGLEILLLVAEPSIFGIPYSEWDVSQHCIHLIITCILWGVIFLALAFYSKKKYGFDIYSFKEIPTSKQWIFSIIIIIISIIATTLINDGIKPVLEFRKLGIVKFIFQYIYYLFESALIILTIVCGQKFGESFFNLIQHIIIKSYIVLN